MQNHPGVDGDTIRAYLERLGLEAEPPSAAALDRLHCAQVERVPYETAWIYLDQRWGINPASSMHRIAHQSRGGYCYHLNGAFALLLRALGYTVTMHTGAVFGGLAPAEQDFPNHLVLTVHGLPSESNADGAWYVDTGLGDALYRPMPLRAGIDEQGPFRYALAPIPAGVGDWQFTHDPAAGSFSGMVWRDAPVGIEAFAERHRRLSTSPDSRFVQVLTAQRRDADGVDALRGRVLRRLGDGVTETLLNTRQEWCEVLDGVFGISLSGFEIAHLDAVWHRIQCAHAAWEGRQASQSSG